MTARDDAIEAGAQALHGDECPDDEHDLCDVGAWDRAAEHLRARVKALEDAGCRRVVGGCDCYLIAKVEAEVRERIAQEISDAWDAAKEKWRSSGDAYWEGRMDALDLAERIARGGESDG